MLDTTEPLPDGTVTRSQSASTKRCTALDEVDASASTYTVVRSQLPRSPLTSMETSRSALLQGAGRPGVPRRVAPVSMGTAADVAPTVPPLPPEDPCA